MSIKIAIFASGKGSNAENVIRYFKNHSKIEVSLVLSNNRNAEVLDRATGLNVPAFVFSREEFYETNRVLELVKDVDWIILAGFLWKFPENILNKFPDKVINIHPALLPKYGGKGMYGMHIHRAVAENKEKETGITIHYVNKNYDEGKIIFQIKTEISEVDTPEDVAKKIYLLEQEFFPKVIESVVGN